MAILTLLIYDETRIEFLELHYLLEIGERRNLCSDFQPFSVILQRPSPAAGPLLLVLLLSIPLPMLMSPNICLGPPSAFYVISRNDNSLASTVSHSPAAFIAPLLGLMFLTWYDILLIVAGYNKRK